MYQTPHRFRRTPKERANQLLSWKRPDPAFFAAGACHILAEAFLRVYPDSGNVRVGLRDTPSSVVNHMLVANEHWVFDFNGYTRVDEFTAAMEHANRERLAGWRCVLYPLIGAFDDICRREHHRLPGDFAHDPWMRADAYLRHFGPPPLD